MESGKGQLFFKLCSDHLSIEAIPRKTIHLDLVKLKDCVISGHELMMWTAQFIVLKNQAGQEITLRKDGRMVIRKATSEHTAESAAAELMHAVQCASRN